MSVTNSRQNSTCQKKKRSQKKWEKGRNVLYLLRFWMRNWVIFFFLSPHCLDYNHTYLRKKQAFLKGEVCNFCSMCVTKQNRNNSFKLPHLQTGSSTTKTRHWLNPCKSQESTHSTHFIQKHHYQTSASISDISFSFLWSTNCSNFTLTASTRQNALNRAEAAIMMHILSEILLERSTYRMSDLNVYLAYWVNSWVMSLVASEFEVLRRWARIRDKIMSSVSPGYGGRCRGTPSSKGGPQRQPWP